VGDGETGTLGDALVGDALVGVGVGLSDVGVGEAVVGVGVGVGDFVGVGVGVGVALVGVGVGVELAGSLAVSLAVGVGVVSVGVGAAVSVAVSEGVAVREGIVGSETEGRPVGTEMLPLPPHAVRSSTPVSATVAIVAVRRARIVRPLVVAADAWRSRRHTLPTGGRAPCGQRQLQRRSSGTDASTWSTCWPHPDQVTLPHARQRAGLHMRTSILRGQVSGVAVAMAIPRGV
jgi:hypothetical protein